LIARSVKSLVDVEKREKTKKLKIMMNYRGEAKKMHLEK